MAAAVATLPGAPLVLAELTPGLSSPPPPLAALREAAGEVVAGLGEQACIVVAPAATASVWLSGDLGLGGFGTGDPPRPWTGGPAGKQVAERLELAATDELPTEARVVARLLDGNVTAIVGLPPRSVEIASLLVSAAREEAAPVVAVGDLSASIGPDSPRPGHDPDVAGLVVDGGVDVSALESLLDGPDASLAAALQVLRCLGPSTPLHGAVHVVRGVATLVAVGS